MDDQQLSTLRAALEREKSTVERELQTYGESVGPGDLDPEGFADSAHVAAERSEALSRIQQLLRSSVEVTAALDRIERGTYGFCESCGEKIAFERLEIVPTARLCVRCKQSRPR